MNKFLHSTFLPAVLCSRLDLALTEKFMNILALDKWIAILIKYSTVLTWF